MRSRFFLLAPATLLAPAALLASTTLAAPTTLAVPTPLVANAVPVAAQLPAATGTGHRHPYRVTDLRVLSGPSPFAGGCPGAGGPVPVTGAEIEPAITANPANRRNIVGTWQQDIGLAGRADLIASTLDGGRTWVRSTIPGMTVCTGGTAAFASDPWLSAGVDGTVYFSGTAGMATADPPPVSVVTSRSHDGGRTWRAPVTVAGLDPGNDTDAITASPTRAGRAYLIWTNWDHTYQPPMANSLNFSRTADWGATWSANVAIDRPGPTQIDFSGHILVLRDGSLLAVFVRADIATGIGSIHAARSLDEGRTWQQPVEVASHPVGTFADPETGHELPQAGFLSAALAPDGTVHLAYEASESVTSGAVGVARSRDGGRTWTTGTLPGAHAFAFEPTVAVDSRGTVGLIWYDIRNDRPGDVPLTTDIWFAQSGDGGLSWRQTHLAGPFDLRSAPLSAGGLFRLGEYQGLTGLAGRGFAAIVTMAAPRAQDGPTDIFLARVGPR